MFLPLSPPLSLPQPRRPGSPTVHVAILSWGVGDASKVLSGAGGRGLGPACPPLPAARASHRPPYPPQTPSLPRAPLRVDFPEPENPGKRNEPQLGRRRLHPSFRSFPPPSSQVPLKTRPRGGPCTQVLASLWARGPGFPTQGLAWLDAILPRGCPARRVSLPLCIRDLPRWPGMLTF